MVFLIFFDFLVYLTFIHSFSYLTDECNMMCQTLLFRDGAFTEFNTKFTSNVGTAVTEEQQSNYSAFQDSMAQGDLDSLQNHPQELSELTALYLANAAVSFSF